MHRLLPTVLLSAALAAQQTAAPPTVAPNSFVPADSCLVARLAAPAKWKSLFAKTQVAKLMQGPSLAPLVAQMTKGIDEGLEQLRKSGQFDADLVEKLLTTYTGELTFSIQVDWADVAAAMQEGRPPAYAMVLALSPDGSYDLDGLAKAIEKMVEDAAEHHRPLRDLTVGDHRLRVTADDLDGQACVPTMVDGHLVMIVASDIEKSAQRLFGTTARYEQPLGKQPFFVHAQVGKAMDAVLAAVAEQAEAGGAPFDVATVIESLGFGALESITLSVDADDQHALGEMQVALGDGDAGLFGMVMFPQTSKLIRLVPPAAEWFSVSPFDPNALYRIVAKVWQEMGDQVPMSLDDAKTAFAEATKVRLEEDILAHLGTEMMMVEDIDPQAAAEIDEESGVPLMIDGSCIVMSLRDGKAFGESVEKALRARGLHAGRKSEDYGDTKVHRMSLAGLVEVEYAITNEALLLVVGDREGARRNLRAVLDARKAAGADAELPAALQKHVAALRTGWSGISVSPIGQLLQGMGSTIESLSGLGEMTEEMEMFGVSATTLSQMLQSIGGEIQRLGIDHLVSATYTTPRSMQVRTRW